MSLTVKQREALNHIKQGEVQNHRFGYGAWRITGPATPNVVGRVISMGMARWEAAPNTSDAKIATLTPSGRLAVESS